ncbi:MAG: 5-deoxy-glucuronate isomerase [Planctomycetes bacterium]|nr:5-deoxy-glucuronate isomerase [Planctomycetota bacterium]
MRALACHGDDRLRSAACEGTRWLARLDLWRPRDPDQIVTGDVETAVIVLAGTFDLVGGGTAWPARGARATPLAGRPMAVYLPPRTTFRAQHGTGELLLVAARQPAAPPEPTGRAGLAQKPLLPLAGSGKAFDPTTGEWLPAEAFPTAPESLSPRRMQHLQVGAVAVERVLAPDYKAATLSVDEAVLPPGTTLRLQDVPGRPRAEELLLFVRGEAARVQAGGAAAAVLGEAAFVVTDDALEVTAGAAPAYVVFAYAGKGS